MSAIEFARILHKSEEGQAIQLVAIIDSPERSSGDKLMECGAFLKAFVAGQKRLELFYLPAYSPDFNPDEGVWSHLKSQELKAHQATNKEELIKKTHEALERMAKRPVLIRSFFKRCNIT